MHLGHHMEATRIMAIPSTQPNGPVYPQQPVYPYNQPGYGYPYGSYGEREMRPWGGE